MKVIILDEIGKKYGRWTVVSYFKHNKYSQVYFNCLCDCGNKKVVIMGSLRNGKSVSCGCYGKEKTSEANTKHGMSGNKHGLYSVWRGMKTRCCDKNFPQYMDYGGRGISVCKEWGNNFKSFFDWAIINGWEKGLDIDRFPNNNGNYEPDNCRFINRSKNCRNKRNNRLICFNGETKTLTEWCEQMDLNFHTVQHRLSLGWSIYDTLNKRPKYKSKL